MLRALYAEGVRVVDAVHRPPPFQHGQPHVLAAYHAAAYDVEPVPGLAVREDVTVSLWQILDVLAPGKEGAPQLFSSLCHRVPPTAGSNRCSSAWRSGAGASRC